MKERVQLSRRGFLTKAGGGGLAVGASLAAGGLGSLLTGCSGQTSAIAAQPVMPDPKHPVTWPIYRSNQPIADGQLPESNATLRVFARVGHINSTCLTQFATRFRCKVQLSTYATTTQALETLTRGRSAFDVFVGTPTHLLDRLVHQKIVQPLNHSYLPNGSQIWPQLTNPYYDRELRYTVPYTVFTTGFGWRRDLLNADLYTSAAGWTYPWHASFKNKIGVLDDYRASLGLGLLASNVLDLNVADPQMIDTAKTSLVGLAGQAGVRISNNVSENLASGLTPLHLAWSGQIVAAAQLLPSGVPAEVIGYWFPLNGQGPVANDASTVLRGATNPVLAHSFINFMLDPVNAVTNARRDGNTPPLTSVTPSVLVGRGVVPAPLAPTIVLPTFFDAGLKEFGLTPPVDQLWQMAWDGVRRARGATLAAR